MSDYIRNEAKNFAKLFNVNLARRRRDKIFTGKYHNSSSFPLLNSVVLAELLTLSYMSYCADIRSLIKLNLIPLEILTTFMLEELKFRHFPPLHFNEKSERWE